MEKFVVKHYTDDEHPTIKGNGFDGLVIGEDREEAQEFVNYINKIISSIDQKEWTNAAYTIEWLNADEVKVTNHARNQIRVVCGGDLETLLSCLFI